MKLDRLLAITMLLINRKKMTASELARHFEVSERTILRDMEAIGQAGIPIVSYQGVNGGFGIMENFRVDRNVLTEDDVVSIITALKGVTATLEDRKMEGALEKIRGLVSPGNGAHIEGLGKRLVIDFSPWGVCEGLRQKLNRVRQAMEENKVLRFHYTNSSGENAFRVIEPLSIAYKGFSWYIYGYCRTKEDYRVFRLSRMKNPELGEEKFDPARRVVEEINWLGVPDNSRPDVALLMKFAPRARARVEDFFDAENIQVQEDGSILVRVQYPEDAWVYSTILSFGEDVEVLEPERIRTIISEKAKKIWERYQG